VERKFRAWVAQLQQVPALDDNDGRNGIAGVAAGSTGQALWESAAPDMGVLLADMSARNRCFVSRFPLR
jgi:hypothetical protein